VRPYIALMSLYVLNRVKTVKALAAFWIEVGLQAAVYGAALSAIVDVKNYHLYYVTGLAMVSALDVGSWLGYQMAWERFWEQYLLTLPTRHSVLALARILSWSAVSLIYTLPAVVIAGVLSPAAPLLSMGAIALSSLMSSSVMTLAVLVVKLNPRKIQLVGGLVMPLITRFTTAYYVRGAAPPYVKVAASLNPHTYLSDAVRYFMGFKDVVTGDPYLMIALALAFTTWLLTTAVVAYGRYVEGVVRK